MYEEYRPLSIFADNNQIAEGLRATVKGSSNMTLIPDFFIVSIYNLSDLDLATLKNSKRLDINAEGDYSLCSGEIDDIYTHEQGTNVITDIAIRDGKSFWNTRISKTVGGGGDVRSTILNILSNASFGGFQADNPRIPRGQTYVGRLADCISSLAKTANGRAFVTRGVLYVVKKGQSSETVRILEDDIINDQSMAKGIRILKVSAKGYPVGALVEVKGKWYRLATQKIELDNYKHDWSSTLILADEDELEGMVGG